MPDIVLRTAGAPPVETVERRVSFNTEEVELWPLLLPCTLALHLKTVRGNVTTPPAHLQLDRLPCLTAFPLAVDFSLQEAARAQQELDIGAALVQI